MNNVEVLLLFVSDNVSVSWRLVSIGFNSAITKSRKTL